MKYELIIFDLDGTLLDTLADLTEAVNYAMEQLHLPHRTIQEVRAFIGNGNKRLMERCVSDAVLQMSPEEAEAFAMNALKKFHEYYGTHFAVYTRAYEGIPELLKTLKEAGRKVAIVSNKADYAVQKLCAGYFPGLYDFALGDREGIARKPSAEPVQLAIDTLQMTAQHAVYIGDSEVDIETAANAGLECISVDWGFRPRQALTDAGASCILSSPAELLPKLLS